MAQVALVTGGGGLGKAFAAALARDGMKVAIASGAVEGPRLGPNHQYGQWCGYGQHPLHVGLVQPSPGHA